MNINERLTISAILVFIAVLTFIDIYNDYLDGSVMAYLDQTIVGLTALAVVYYLIKSHITMQHTVEKEKRLSNELSLEAQKWKRVSKTYLDGLSVEINKQLDKWELTEAEKRVAFLLLKGLSIKEIADLRKTSEKTVRTQANSIYSKSGLPAVPLYRPFP
jgi:DNA-binding NarL/FixJ family response regulator